MGGGGGSSTPRCVDYGANCRAEVKIPITNLPDGILVTCLDTECGEQAVTNGNISSATAGSIAFPSYRGVQLFNGALSASWFQSIPGFLMAPVCNGQNGNSVSFRSPRGTTVNLFSGKIPMLMTTTFDGCFEQYDGSVTLDHPVDIVELVRAQEAEGGAGGAGNEVGGAGGAP